MFDKMFFLASLPILLTLQQSCGHINTKNTPVDAKLLAVFSDFAYMGYGLAKYRDNGLVDTAYLAQHDESERAPLSKLVKGEQYIFHRQPPPDLMLSPLEILPDRLIKQGFKILTPPDSFVTMHLYYGGPLFTIYFADGGKQFAIFNIVHRIPESSWDEHAYVLVYIR